MTVYQSIVFAAKYLHALTTTNESSVSEDNPIYLVRPRLPL
jgi:hypothetical protein